MIVPLFGFSLFVGWFASDLTAPEPPAKVIAEAPAAPSAQVQQAAANAAQVRHDTGGVVLQRQPDGQFYADVDVDGTQIHFIIDTGASGLALTGADAEALGLRWDDQDLQPVGRGASGPVYGTRVTLGSVELGGIEAHNVEAAIVPTGLHVSLLGQSFLSKAESVTIRGNTLHLY